MDVNEKQGCISSSTSSMLSAFVLPLFLLLLPSRVPLLQSNPRHLREGSLCFVPHRAQIDQKIPEGPLCAPHRAHLKTFEWRVLELVS